MAIAFKTKAQGRPAWIVFFALCFALLCGACQSERSRTKPIAIAGTLADPGLRLETGETLALNGQWQVVWGELVEPDAFDARYSGDLFELPGRWNKIDAPGMQGSRGAATFRLQLELPEYVGDVAIHLISPHSSWRLYVDGQLKAANGTVTASPAGAKTNYVSRMVPAKMGTSVLVLQVSNYSHAYGGPGHPLVLWDGPQLVRHLELISLYYVLIFGVLLSIGLYHLIVFLAESNRDLAASAHLWLAVLCAIILFRISGIIPYFHLHYPNEIYWSDLKLTYVSLFAAPAIYLLFFRAAFPNQMPNKLTRYLIGFCTSLTAIVFVTPESVYTALRNFSILLNLGAVIFTLWFTAIAARAREAGATAILLVNFVFLLTAINDALIYTDTRAGFDLTPFGVLLLGVGYSYVLLFQLQRRFSIARQTSDAYKSLSQDLERQVVERTRSFEAAAARAENNASDRAKFIAAASHDLRQPLHALALLNGALKRSASDQKIAGLVGKQSQSISNLSELLQDTLDASKLDINASEPVPEMIDITAFLDQLAAMYRPKATKQNVELSVAAETGRVRSDRGMLQRVLGNLIDNAINAAQSRVEITARDTASGWHFEVGDDGVGIEIEDASRIFDPYVSLSDQKHEGGYGLGLYVVKQFAAALKGRVHVGVSKSGGAAFKLEIPDLDDVSAATVSDIDHDLLPMPGFKVVFVDDDGAIRQAMQILIESWGGEIEVAAGGRQAAQVLNDGFAPDFLMVDYHLRDSNGVEIAQALQAQGGRVIPTLVLTGATEPRIKRHIREAGFALLQKPVQPGQLSAFIRSNQT